ncbi:MAG: tRNA (cytidine(56)-2'-O)-methyltransferase [Thermoplasmata archaeon]
MATGSSGSRRTRPRNPRPEVSVLRVGHRVGRDPRLTTHLALAARALGARRMYLEPPDPDLAARVAALGRGWGGAFEVVGVEEWKKVVRTSGALVVHLTMYGEPLDTVLPRLRRARRLLLAVGGAKVPPDLYRLADVNVAVGHQPHSEVAAVAIVLERLLGVPGPRPFPGATRRIVPQVRGKRVVARGGRR